jgi:hypothetical protein
MTAYEKGELSRYHKPLPLLQRGGCEEIKSTNSSSEYDKVGLIVSEDEIKDISGQTEASLPW